MERSEADSKKCKGNQVKLVNPNILRFSCEDGKIPEWLLVEVLLRLPVKSVFRSKLVSKQWLSVISDPYFVRAYVSRATLLSPQPWTIVPIHMCNEGSRFSNLDYELLKDLCVKPSLNLVDVPSIHEPGDEENYYIYGVSNGLMCYWVSMGGGFEYIDHVYYVCNPLTGHCLDLPPVDCMYEWCGWGFHTHVADGFLKSYSLVGIVKGSNRLTFQVYVSEIGEWKDFTVPCNLFPLHIHREAAAMLNGIFHWIALGHGIIAYDPYRNPENMRIIAFPGDSVGKNEFLCVECQGKLRFLEVGLLCRRGVAFPSFKVWVLNDYNSGDWCLQHNIRGLDVQYGANFPRRRSSISPVCFHPFDSDILYLACDGVCVSYNMKTRKLQVEDEFFRHCESFLDQNTDWWEPSLLFVVPHWPPSIPLPSHGAFDD